MKAWRRCVVLSLTVLALGGCALLGGRHAALTVYAPALAHAPAAPQVAPAPRAWQLAVLPPQTSTVLDNARIVVAPAPGVIEYYKDARWQDTPPAMLQNLLVLALHERAGLDGAAPASSGIHADYLLRSDLHAFQAEYRGARKPLVNVALTYQLVRAADGRVVAAHAFAREEDCAGTQLPDVFAAFGSAINAVLEQVVEWTVREADADSRRASAKE